MPVCRSTFGALSRHRVPAAFSASKTLVPFLYHTATIQQWKPASQPIARRDASSRSRNDDAIPFETTTEALPASIDDVSSPRRTTITGSERAAFEKLYKKFNTAEESKSQNEIPFAHEVDQIADEWYEEDDDSSTDTSEASLDSVFDAVLSGLPAGRTLKRTPKKPAEDFQILAERILKPEVEEARKKPKKEALAEAARIKGIREEEKIRVEGLLEHAKTDRELWEILHREVFAMIEKLDLDGAKQPHGQQKIAAEANRSLKEGKSGRLSKATTAESTPSTSATSTAGRPVELRYDPRILFPNYPSHLIYATRLLRNNFPSSPLPLSILPTIKSLGRSSYALGATTPLYNLLIRTVWVQHSSYDYIDELLTDMDNGGVEPDNATLQLLDDILSEHDRSQKGRLGETMKQVWRMEMFIEGARRLTNWRDTIAQRLSAWSERRAAEGNLVRFYDDKTRAYGGLGGSKGRADDFQFMLSKENRRRARIVKARNISHRPKILSDHGVEASVGEEAIDAQSIGAEETLHGVEASAESGEELKDLSLLECEQNHKALV